MHPLPPPLPLHDRHLAPHLPGPLPRRLRLARGHPGEDGVRDQGEAAGAAGGVGAGGVGSREGGCCGGLCGGGGAGGRGGGGG